MSSLPIRRIDTGPRSGQTEHPRWETIHLIEAGGVATCHLPEGNWKPFSSSMVGRSSAVLVSYRRQFYPSDREKK